METGMQTTAHQDPSAIRSLRWAADMLCLWALCAKPACRRARQCRRDPQGCFKRFAPLVPEAAVIAVAAMAEGKRCGLGYDELRAEGPAEMAAYEDWIARVAAAARAAAAPAGDQVSNAV
jgi:hypothetical protein